MMILVNKVKKLLDDNYLNYEVCGDEYTFSISPVCEIHTDNCTIWLEKKKIKVDDKVVQDTWEMIEEVLAVERC
ncbi:hypothetical protein NV379_02515 [Paenibacillus sp. N1-5-1-14]|uniref:hypothetical protein n=1 Tax=Paenibacillus radicibacter TaxID=2972488 RepID=UPI0021596674|nr:hypothetical protein [Paenibacillus radicibacter]MCR8641520.1 hypothetical protein [Paenibacillus radicibacter]